MAKGKEVSKKEEKKVKEAEEKKAAPVPKEEPKKVAPVAEAKEEKKEKKKEKKSQKERPRSKKKHKKIQVWKLYSVSGNEVKRKNEPCPRCGPGTFLASYKNRKYCGRCGWAEIKDEKK
jgi:small subunit ribosomal protein S27Ae